MDRSQLHIAILSSPGMGHLIPVLVLGNRLAAHYNIKITILAITTSSSSAETEFLKKSTLTNEKKTIEIIPIPSVDISHLINSSTKVFTQLRLMVREALPKIHSTIASMTRRPDALIVDIFCTQILPIAEEFKISKYAYHPTTAWTLALAIYCQVFDKEIEGEYVDLKDPLKIPGCKALRPDDVVDPLLDRSDQQYEEYVKLGMEYAAFDGILINTWEDLEPETIKALRNNEKLRSVLKMPVLPIFPVGPLRRTVETTERDEVIQWLDKQNHGSVLYVSFGSGGTLSTQQMTELALGLELSQQKFVWVVRPPFDGDADSAYMNSTGKETRGMSGYLPEGFLTRTNGMGLVVSLWAKQVEILGHSSVGGFLTHCGWNSTVESLTNGVPMIAWPLYAEQKMNAAMLTEELGVAIRPAVLPTKVVKREEIEGMVRMLMHTKEGKTIREKAKKLKMSAQNALSDGGSSYNSICELVKDIRSRLSVISL
ncbi:anthocyanidin 3-O-glucosyltransferase 5-like [Nicotiana tomentosiformis]|uniref:anthocyanidin 3-O-glucosyltransferase 5-like n=1 Tax=Nicotiana tomentosiformis TaxID=4098 RepID=UPI00051AC2AB|nr:anthocyanidin 3-O-glucosyltransferase 5-like [Nicotiana tomentosiformis]